jgi:hypothetical protein
MKKAKALHGEIVSICPAEAVASVERLDSEHLKLLVPAHWRPERALNEHAARVQEETLKWFYEMGFKEEQLVKVRTFQPSHYVGVPFPMAGPKETLLISRYLSLWLLWDDIDVESGEHGWKIDVSHVLSGRAPAGATRFDLAWLALLQELARTMSPSWLDALCKAMVTWSDAALVETRISRQWMAGDASVSFAESLKSRIDTIGMYATAYLIEYAHGFELPLSFHEHWIVRAMKTLSNKIVGLGNDIFSAGKDYASGYINVFFTLMNELSIPMTEACVRVVKMHNDAMVEYDALASSLPSFGPRWDPLIAQWVQSLRYCSLGFSLWESGAPRYAKYKLVVNGKVFEPTFAYYNATRGPEVPPPSRPLAGLIERGGAPPMFSSISAGSGRNRMRRERLSA